MELEHAPVWAKEIYHSFPALVSYKDISAQTHLAKGALASICSRKEDPDGGFICGNKKGLR